MHWDQRPRDSVAPRKIRERLPGPTPRLAPAACARPAITLAAALIAELSPNFLHAELSERVWVLHFLVVLELINGDGTNNRLTFVRPLRWPAAAAQAAGGGQHGVHRLVSGAAGSPATAAAAPGLRALELSAAAGAFQLFRSGRNALHH